MKKLIQIQILIFATLLSTYSQTFRFNNKEIQLENVYKIRISNGTEIIGRIVGYSEERGITVQFSSANSYTYTLDQVLSIEELTQTPVFGGAGMGIPYGVFGLQLGVAPIDQLEITAGAGSTLIGGHFAWDFGLKGHFVPKGEEFRPFVSGYYGINGVIHIMDYTYNPLYSEAFKGFSIGGGLVWSMDNKRKHSFTAEILYIINEDLENAMDRAEINYGEEFTPWQRFPLKISTGYRYNF